jgi:Domain of unknown function (DUF4416)
MGELRWPDPVLLIVAVISRYDRALTWAQDRLQQSYGRVALCSPAFDFNETQFYQASMGSGLKKQFLAFCDPIDSSLLPEIKRLTNEMETEFAGQFGGAERRPLNLDPGYITAAKLVLATTKDRDHRIYLRDGIFAEVTLHFQRGQWTTQRWTYPDYQRADFHAFFTTCRDYLRALPPEMETNDIDESLA